MRIYSVLYLQTVFEIQHREGLVWSDLLPPDSRCTILCVYLYIGAATFGFLKIYEFISITLTRVLEKLFFYPV
jgi:hypothetical protein